MASSSTEDVLLYFLAIFIPPLPVFFKRGCHVDLWINILLWFLGWIPGVLHSWWVISKSSRPVIVAVATPVAVPVAATPVATPVAVPVAAPVAAPVAVPAAPPVPPPAK